VLRFLKWSFTLCSPIEILYAYVISLMCATLIWSPYWNLVKSIYSKVPHYVIFCIIIFLLSFTFRYAQSK
jgi:hypothetical protein